jgi:hypothetical protein
MSGIQQTLLASAYVVPVTPGQQEFVAPNQATPLDVSFAIPAGVTSISACLVSGDAGVTITLKRNGSVVMSVTQNSRSGCDGGGNGGLGGGSYGGGGGAGGYSGAGGDGGLYQTTGAISDGTSGLGGGGGGGGGGHITMFPLPNQGGSGGAVGLKGIGTSGGGGVGAGYVDGAGNGGDGSGAPGLGLFGAGGVYPAFSYSGQAGGGLGWANNIAVSPGDIIRVECPLGFTGFGNGGGRIMWGGGRSYPSNAGDM